jgi:RsiW-degrading membrane proteinase PrsW (M82 family)
MTAPAVGLELYLINTINSLSLPAIIAALAKNIIAVAFIEEFVKYAAVWLKEQAINQNNQLDEPVDFVIYMVASAMGFAAVENILFLLMPGPESLVIRSMYRAVSAILLHALCSGVMGYHMAEAFCHRERKISLLVTGFITVSCLHGLYNFSIMKSESDISYLLIPLAIILLLAITLYFQFQHLLRTKGVCDMKIK